MPEVINARYINFFLYTDQMKRHSRYVPIADRERVAINVMLRKIKIAK